jgi:hypothetical protein
MPLPACGQVEISSTKAAWAAGSEIEPERDEREALLDVLRLLSVMNPPWAIVEKRPVTRRRSA